MFSRRLKELRENNDLSMDKLIESYNLKFDAKMNKSTLSRYENGLQDPIYTVVVNLARLFNVSVDYISGESNIPNKALVEQMQQDKTFELTNDERKLVYDYRELSEQGQEYIKQTMFMARETYKKYNNFPTENIEKRG